ncbi:hypothetical protein JDV02_002074 [Purpureocillium takamizusanense]|uniref:DUF7029 domain-containing protein n=1 Tax=Purpureocillium takamizusanense TaxID=2060973 RepID=A0A9Q8Q9L0_9HYPO|nr:uncharacterized protein JDV02_002074 [Purpureocillium takamizusanense]UNI15550.1 hypothetical protein JDV02_002074 [Purpureocillium takamizusanense]
MRGVFLAICLVAAVRVAALPTGGTENTSSPASTAIPTRTNKFGFSGTQTATFHSASSAVTLAPNVHWTEDTKEVKNVIPLSPRERSYLYYGAGDPSEKGPFGVITYNFVSPSVNLDHSDHIKAVYDKNEGLKLTFTNKEAFNHATDTWHPKDRGLILVVYIDGCEAHKSGERCYFKASSLDVRPQDMTIIVSCKAHHPNDLIASGESHWGWWDPGSSPARRSLESPGKGGEPANDVLMEHIYPGAYSKRENEEPTGRGRFWTWIDDYIIKPFKKGAKSVWTSLAINHDFNRNLPFKFPESPEKYSVLSPWGAGILLSSVSMGSKPNQSADIYCVGCGASGNATLSGKVKWTPFTGMTEGQVYLHLDARFALKIGIDAHAQSSHNFTKQLYNRTFDATSFGGFSVVPGMDVAVNANITTNSLSEGRLLAGAEMDVQDAHVVYDLVEPSRNNVGGWYPQPKPIIESNDTLIAEAKLSLPLRVSCRILIHSVDYGTAWITHEPSVNFTAQSAKWAELEGGEVNRGSNGTDTCTGIRTRLSWRNKLLASAKIPFVGRKEFLLWDSYERPIGPSCIP